MSQSTAVVVPSNVQLPAFVQAWQQYQIAYEIFRIVAKSINRGA